MRQCKLRLFKISFLCWAALGLAQPSAVAAGISYGELMSMVPLRGQIQGLIYRDGDREAAVDDRRCLLYKDAQNNLIVIVQSPPMRQSFGAQGPITCSSNRGWIIFGNPYFTCGNCTLTPTTVPRNNNVLLQAKCGSASFLCTTPEK